jgi:hypothetical protein
MKAILSTTYDDQYLFYIPITTWLWNKLGVDVICFFPSIDRCHLLEWHEKNGKKTTLISGVLHSLESGWHFEYFSAPKHKESTYAQCSRIYAACLDLPEDEILITSDIDMGLFKLPTYIQAITIFGADLVPVGQYPMCYASGTAKDWRIEMNIGGKTYQEGLDELLGGVEADHFRGNYWAKDQETLFNKLGDRAILVDRARPGTQFASNRIDRDDAYFMERLSPDIIDYHFHRPGYTGENFQKILSVIKYFYPYEDFQWMMEYQQQYLSLINKSK